MPLPIFDLPVHSQLEVGLVKKVLAKAAHWQKGVY
jgi:hypothetical protein